MTRQRVLLRGALASTPGDLVHVVRRLDDETVREVLAHLVAVEQATAANLRRVAASDGSTLTDEHADVSQRGDHSGPISSPGPAQLLQQFETTRRETLCHLDDLPDDGWSRVVDHAALGATRVITVVRRLLDHDLAHLGTLAETRQPTRLRQQQELEHG